MRYQERCITKREMYQGICIKSIKRERCIKSIKRERCIQRERCIKREINREMHVLIERCITKRDVSRVSREMYVSRVSRERDVSRERSIERCITKRKRVSRERCISREMHHQARDASREMYHPYVDQSRFKEMFVLRFSSRTIMRWKVVAGKLAVIENPYSAHLVPKNMYSCKVFWALFPSEKAHRQALFPFQKISQCVYQMHS